MSIDSSSAAEIEQVLLKKLTTVNGEITLTGLVIDWHLAEYDVPADVSTAPVLDTGLAYQPTYAYA